MLTPQQLNNCADSLIPLCAKLEQSIVDDIARKIIKTGDITEGAKQQAERLQESGQLYTDVIHKVAVATEKSNKEIKRMFENAAVASLEFDMSIYQKAGLQPLPLNMSPAAMQVLSAGYNKTIGQLHNLTKTTALSAQKTFIDACTLAEMQVTSGAFDYNTAIRNAIQKVANDYVYVKYPSGHKERLDVAVRRNVMTGLGQTTGQIGLQYAYDMDCDLMEITAHSGARPSHARFQGQIVSLSGRQGYLTLEDIGYGTGSGFKGWNCYHDWYPYIEGVSNRMYKDEYLKLLDAKNIEYDGKMYTEYEIQQKMRNAERDIRNMKRNLSAYNKGINTTTSTGLKNLLQQDFNKASVKLKKREIKYINLCTATGQLQDKARVQVYGFGRSTAQKAVWAHRKEVEKYTKYHYNKSGNILITNDWKARKHPTVPKQYKPHAIVETKTMRKNGTVQIDRSIYNADAKLEKQIHSSHHNRPKQHPYGNNGEHTHDYVWDGDKIMERIDRNLTKTERKEHGDIL